jgi:hypothetical protein
MIVYAMVISRHLIYSEYNYYFWVPVVAPFVGALLGVWTYQFFVGLHIPAPTQYKEYVVMHTEKEVERMPLKEHYDT